MIPTPTMMMYIGASSTPTVWEDKCYVTGSAGLYCLNVKDGSVVWQAKTRFSNSSPLVHKGVVYCFLPATDRLEAKTGKVLWSERTGVPIGECRRSCLWNTGGKDYLLGGKAVEGGPTYFSVEAATGKNVWTSRPSKGHLSEPGDAGDIMASMATEPGARAYRITPRSATSSGEGDVPDYRGASLSVHDGYVYCTSGRTSAPRCDVST